MDTKKYEAFEKTVELQSLTKAAQELGLTQSGVSHMLSAIEAELQLPLLKRTRTGARLTPEGEQMMPYIHEIVRQERLLRQAAERLHTLVTGKIRIGTFTSVATHWLPAMMMQFQKEHPQVDFQLFNGDYHDIDTGSATAASILRLQRFPPVPAAAAHRCTRMRWPPSCRRGTHWGKVRSAGSRSWQRSRLFHSRNPPIMTCAVRFMQSRPGQTSALRRRMIMPLSPWSGRDWA